MEAEAFFKMDIFFFVTTFVVVVLGLLLSILFYYLIKVVRDISEITDAVKKEAHGVVEDLREVRKDVKEGVATAKRYTKAVAGAGMMRIVTSMVETLLAERSEKKGKTSRTKRSTKAKKKDEETEA